MDLIDIYRTFHPKAAEYTFFSSARGTFSLRRITSWATNPTSVTLRKLQSYQASFPTTTPYNWTATAREKTAKKHKHVETKQHATKQPMDH